MTWDSATKPQPCTCAMVHFSLRPTALSSAPAVRLHHRAYEISLCVVLDKVGAATVWAGLLVLQPDRVHPVLLPCAGHGASG